MGGGARLHGDKGRLNLEELETPVMTLDSISHAVKMHGVFEKGWIRGSNPAGGGDQRQDTS